MGWWGCQVGIIDLADWVLAEAGLAETPLRDQDDPERRSIVNRSSMVRVKGPLEPYARGLARKLAEQGYGPESAARHLRLMGRLSSWLDARGLHAGTLTWSLAGEFVCERRAAGCGARVSLSAMGPLLDYLRGAGAVPLMETSMSVAPVDQLVAAYSGYLAGERALARRSIDTYARVARRFLAWRCGHRGGELALAQLTAGDVTAFVLQEHGRGSVASARRVVAGLRSLLRYLHVEGHTAGPLAPAVLAVPGWRGSTPQRGLAAGQVARLLAGFDRRTALGRRDYAMVTVMARLGLRAGEVAAIDLDDIDWRAGELTVAGKGDRRERLPVPGDVGQALAGYCLRGRPRTSCRALFVRARAPRTRMSADAVAGAVRRGAARAGMPGVGAHRLRHTAATQMLRAGGSLFEVGAVLRQRRSSVTAVYAKADPAALRLVARRWPGSAA
jgi:integrase/recombinase XerD